MAQRARSPVLGYNHNLRHGGRVFHVQTEDSGTGYARLYTHLFFEGTILSSKKQEYDPAAPEDMVRGLMQQLHKTMIKELTHGGHDPRIAAFFASRGMPAVLDDARSPAKVEAPAAVAAAQQQPELPRLARPLPATARPDPAPPVVAPALASSTPAPLVVRGPAPRPKPVVVKPGGLQRPPVVLSSSADGVVVRRNVVINVGGGAPPVHGSGPGAQAVPVSPRALGSSKELRMPWDAPAPVPVLPVAPAPVAADLSGRTSRQLRMPWDPPAPTLATDAFANDLVNDKSLDEVILEYLSDDGDEDR